MSRKHEAINLLALYAKGSANGWNEILNICLKNMDINALAILKYRLQAGMTDAANAKLNSWEVIKLFIRLDRSLAETAKKIIRIKHPMPHDNPLIAKDYSKEKLETKRKRDHDLNLFFKKSSY